MNEVIIGIPETPVANAITTWSRIYRRFILTGSTNDDFLLQYGDTPINMPVSGINTVGELIDILLSIGL